MKTWKRIAVASSIALVAVVIYWLERSPVTLVKSTNVEKRVVPNNHSQAVISASPTGSISKPSIVPEQKLSKPTKDELLSILSSLRTTPHRSLATNFTPSDESALLERFRVAKRPSERLGLIWVLANVGGDETASAFINSLTSEFAGRSLANGADQSDERAMESLVLAMGLLASRNDRALEFLKSGVDPEFWRRTVVWTPSSRKDVYWMLTGQSIAGLGLTGRSEVDAILQRLKSKPPQETEGAIVDAAYYMAMNQSVKKSEFYGWFLDRSTDEFDPDGTYRAWKSSPSGLDWRKWYEAQNAQ